MILRTMSGKDKGLAIRACFDIFDVIHIATEVATEHIEINAVDVEATTSHQLCTRIYLIGGCDI